MGRSRKPRSLETLSCSKSTFTARDALLWCFLWGIFNLAVPAFSETIGIIDGFLASDKSYTGTSTLKFLSLPVSARSSAMGGHSSTTESEASVLQINPALLGTFNDYSYTISHTEVLGEFRHEYLATTIPTREWGSFGFGANVLLATAFENARDIDEEPSSPTAMDLALGLGYGKNLWENRLAVGGRLDLIRSAIDDVGAYTYAASLSSTFFLAGSVRLAVNMEHLSHGIQYNTATAALEPVQKALSIEIGRLAVKFPLGGHIGLLKNGEGNEIIYGGSEWDLFQLIKLRAGYQYRSLAGHFESNSALTLGFGLSFANTGLDYAFRNYSPLGQTHQVTVNYSRKGVGPLKDDELLSNAREAYRAGKLKKALGLATSALHRNPNNLSAVALVQQIKQELLRLEGLSISIFYTANNRGTLVPQTVSGQVAGGLARRKTKLFELKDLYPHNLVVDAGDLSSLEALQGFEKLIYEAIGQMPYDAINLGQAERLAGTDLLGPVQSVFRLPLFSANVYENSIPLQKEKVFTSKRGLKVALIGLMSPDTKLPPGSFVKNEKQKMFQTLDWLAAARSWYLSWKESPDISIVLLRGDRAAAQQLVQRIPDLSLIVLSGDESAFSAPVIFGNTLVLSPGQLGTKIGHLSLQFKQGKGITGYSHELVPIGQNVVPDPAIQALLEPAVVSFSPLASNAMAVPSKSQVFVYVNAASGEAAGNLSLKDMKSNLEFKLGSAKSPLGISPVLSYRNSRVAFISPVSREKDELRTQQTKSSGSIALAKSVNKIRILRFSPSEAWLYYIAESQGQWDLWRSSPTSDHGENITQGRFGEVFDFDVSSDEQKIALGAKQAGKNDIWVGDLSLKQVIRINEKDMEASQPRWHPNQERLAFLQRNSSYSRNWNLSLYDFGQGKLFNLTEGNRVEEICWAADGTELYYTAGINLTDLNACKLSDLSQRKLTKGSDQEPRSEKTPIAKEFKGEAGLLFEARYSNRREIRWVNTSNGPEEVMVSQPGYNRLR